MRIHQTDTLSLDAIRADQIKNYLIQHGWKQVPFRREGLLVFEGPKDDDGESIVQVIPRSERASDFGLRAADLVDALSVIEDRPPEEIVREITEANASASSSQGPASPWTRPPLRRAWRLAISISCVALLLFMSGGLWVATLGSHPVASQFLMMVCLSNALVITASVILFRGIATDNLRTDETIRGLREEEADLAAEVRRLDRDLARIGRGATHPNGALARAFAVSLAESIKHGDEWLRIKSIDSLAELAGADPIDDVAEPVLAWAAGDEGSSPAVRSAAVKLLGRLRANK
jgi:hypothetical protein